MALEPGRRLAWLALMEPYDTVKGITVLQRYATSTLSAFNSGPWGGRGTIRGAINEPFSIRATLLRTNKIAEHANPSVGDIVLKNKNGELDHLLDYSWPGRRIELRLGYADDTSMASFDDVAPLGVKWIGTAKQIRATKTEIVIPLRGIEDLFDIPLQQDRYNPGYEPSVIGDGVDNMIDFGNVLDHNTTGFTIAVAFRTSDQDNQFLYGRKSSIGGVAAGYGLALGAGGAVRFDLADGSIDVTATFSPPGGYNDGQRHTVIGAWRTGVQVMELWYDGVLVDSVATNALGSVSNTQNLTAMATGGVASAFLDGGLERIAHSNSGGNTVTDQIQAALDERYAEDVDPASINFVAHYVPLTENLGDTANDLSSNGFDGTLTGEADPDAFWSGLREGTPELGGKPHPICYGRVHHARPVLVDPIKGIWEVHDRAIDTFIDLFEGGVTITRDTTTVGDIWTNPPASGEYRFQNGNSSNGTRALVRLQVPGGTDNLQADLTFSALGDAEGVGGYSDRMQDHVQRVLSQHGDPVYDGPIHTVGLPLTSEDPDYTTGFYWRDEITIARALDEILATADFHWTVNGRRPFDTTQVDDPMVLTFLQIRDVSGETPDVVITLDSPDAVSGVARDGFEVASHVPHWQDLVIEFDKRDGWMPLSESLPGAPITRRALLAKEYRSLGPPLLVQPQAILDAYLEGESKTIQTGIRFTSDAHEEGLRRLGIYDRPRPVSQLERTADEWGLWIAAVVQVNGTRFGTGAGPKYLLLGIEDRTRKGVAGTRMWLYGGFTGGGFGGGRT